MGFKDKLSQTLNAAADKSAELAGLAKVKMEISNTKSSIQKLYKEIGAAVYAASKSGDAVSEEVDTCCDEIEKLIEKLTELEDSLKQ